MTIRLLLVASMMAVTFFAPIRARGQGELSGEVVDAETGRPVPGVVVGAVRAGFVETLDGSQFVEPEQTQRTDTKGRFAFDVDPAMPGIDRVAVFYSGEEKSGRIHRGALYSGRLPRRRDFAVNKVIWFDLTRRLEPVSLKLRTAGAVFLMVPMRDGTKLATDLYLPEGEGPWPVLMMRTPYGKSEAAPLAQQATRAGYAFVAQDFRGRHGSEGLDNSFRSEGWGVYQDGYDAIQWAASQPWCNGKVGTVGGSARGITQILTAGAAPPHLVCQHIGAAAGDFYRGVVYQGGAFRREMVDGWLTGQRFRPEVLQWNIDHRLDGPHWDLQNVSLRSEEITVPAVFTSGWYDCFSQGTIDAFVWRQTQGGEGAKGRQKLIMKPTAHGDWTFDPALDVRMPTNANQPPDSAPGQGAWFDHWLKGVDNGVEHAPAVTYYVMGDLTDPEAPGNQWRTADAWPIPATPTKLYLRASGRLDRRPPDSLEPPDVYEFDPNRPVPTRGGNNLTIDKGPMDQRPVEDRDDVILFTSDPLPEPLEVTGRIRVKLWASSTAVDTDFTAKLTDVYPDGRSLLVLDGIIRARHRNTGKRDEFLNPGEIYEFDVDLWSTSLIFNTGHRIRLAISSSNYPRFDVNPNNGGTFRDDKPAVMARNTIHHDAKHPSHLLLPIIE